MNLCSEVWETETILVVVQVKCCDGRHNEPVD
jgi:hypothetical protein